METLSAIASGIGWLTLAGVSFFAGWCIYDLTSAYLFNCSRFCWIMLKAERIHGDAISDKWKERPFWKFRFVLNLLFSKTALELTTLGPEDSISGRRFYYSRKKMYVRGVSAEKP